MVFTAGLILDSVARSRAEQLRIHYLNVAAPSQGLAPEKSIETAQGGRTTRIA